VRLVGYLKSRSIYLLSHTVIRCTALIVQGDSTEYDSVICKAVIKYFHHPNLLLDRRCVWNF